MTELELRKQLACYPFITGGRNLCSVLLEALRFAFLVSFMVYFAHTSICLYIHLHRRPDSVYKESMRLLF